MNAAEIISRKRDRHALTEQEIAFMVDGYVSGQVADYQMASWAMAVFLNGMTPAETACLTRNMLHSGQVLQWPTGRPKVDKHSTGGVGDKISVPLTPILACCGMDVPMISGRGLGATGGTIDKLESIEGFNTNLPLDAFRRQVERIGCAITAASSEIAPADRKLYALRDVTGTVPSVPLITASILSKKLAEGLDALILDVKWGSGAFMKTQAEAMTLARSLVDVSQAMGVRAKALLTDMNQPLGRMIGNGLEIDESVDILRGEGPQDARQLTWELAAELLLMTKLESTRERALQKVVACVRSGQALEKLTAMVAAQGGNLDAARPRAPRTPYLAPRSGFVASIDAEQLGYCVIDLGGGRKKLGDPIDPSVGLEMLVRIGDAVERSQPLVNVFSAAGLEAVESRLAGAIEIADSAPPARPLIADTYG